MVTGIGVPAITGTGGIKLGRSALDDRLMVYADYTSLGLIRGGKVSTSSSGMKYTIGHGNANMSIAVASRSAADGATKFPIVAQTVNTTAAPASGARIDVVWARQNRPDLGDADNSVVAGVTQGAASASPSTPSIPAGAVVLATYRVPSGITATSGASLVSVGPQAVPYGAALGVLAEKIYNLNESPIPAGRNQIITVPLTFSSPRNIALQVTGSAKATSSKWSEALYQVFIDGVDKRQMRFLLDSETDTSLFQYTEYETVSAGTHTFRLDTLMPHGGGRYMYSAGKWPGQKLTIVDLGVNDG